MGLLSCFCVGGVYPLWVPSPHTPTPYPVLLPIPPRGLPLFFRLVGVPFPYDTPYTSWSQLHDIPISNSTPSMTYNLGNPHQPKYPPTTIPYSQVQEGGSPSFKKRKRRPSTSARSFFFLRTNFLFSVTLILENHSRERTFHFSVSLV